MGAHRQVERGGDADGPVAGTVTFGVTFTAVPKVVLIGPAGASVRVAVSGDTVMFNGPLLLLW